MGNKESNQTNKANISLDNDSQKLFVCDQPCVRKPVNVYAICNQRQRILCLNGLERQILRSTLVSVVVSMLVDFKVVANPFKSRKCLLAKVFKSWYLRYRINMEIWGRSCPGPEGKGCPEHPPLENHK